MTEQYPYRPDNHYEFPRTPQEVIDDEIKMYPDGKEFRKFVVGLSRQYAEVPLMKAMQNYAKFMGVAQMDDAEGIKATTVTHDGNFLAGSVLALHTRLYAAPEQLRRTVLQQNPLEELIAAPESREKSITIENLVEYMKIWAAEGASQSYADQGEEMQEKILQLSIAVYNDIEKPMGMDTRFIAGYLFADELIGCYSYGAINPPV